MFDLLKYFYKNFKFSIASQILALCITLLYSGTIILSPIASKYLINKVLNTTDMRSLQIGIFIFFIACILQPLTGLINDIVFVQMNLKISSSISRRMFEKVINAKMNFFDSSRNGDIISRINNDGNAISNFISGFFIVYIKDLLVILFIIIGMFYMSIKITIIIIILLFLNLLINKLFSSKFRKISSEIAKNNDSIISYTNQSINSIITIKTFNCEEKVKKDYGKIVDKVVSDNKKNKLLNIYISNLNNLIGIMSLSVIYGFGAIEILKGQMDIGSLIGLGLYFQLILSPLDEFINNNIQLSSIQPMLGRLKEYLNLEQEIYNKENVIIENNDFFSLNDVSFSYQDKLILDTINLSFNSTGLVGIVGESGAGKSTIIKLIFKFYEPTSGNIYLGYNNYTELDVSTVRSYISLVNQDVSLFNLSIEDNIRYVNSNITKEEIIRLCKQVNLHDTIESFDNGYDTIINEKLNLSGGERQRLGIIMALAKNPSILILDEPTSSLDYKNELMVMNIIKEISKEKLVILISHKETSINFAELVYVLQNKKIILRNNYKD